MKKKYFSSAQLIPISFLAAIIIGWIDKSPAELNADCRLLIVLEKSRLGKLK